MSDEETDPTGLGVDPDSDDTTRELPPDADLESPNFSGPLDSEDLVEIQRRARPRPTPTPVPASSSAALALAEPPPPGSDIVPADLPPASRPQLALHPFSQAQIDEVVSRLSTTMDPTHTHMVAAGVDNNGVEVAVVLKSVGGIWQFRAAARRDWDGTYGAGARLIASW